MKQFSWLLLFCVLRTFYVSGQPGSIPVPNNRKINEKSVLFGKVTSSKTGAPLPGASVYIHETRSGAIASGDGRYRTAAIPSGTYLVEISFVGYESILSTISVNGSIEKNFSLNESAVEQEGVTVTGVSTPTRIRLSPQPVSVLKKSDLASISVTNIMQAVSIIPGVNVVSTGPAIGKPFIRGLGYNRVVTVNDGVRQEGQQWGDEHGIEIDDYSVQRVEVLKGPASLTYGSDALAGVINIQSQLPAPEGTITGTVSGEYQSNSRLRGAYGAFGATNNGFSINLYGSYKAAEDYRNKFDGRVFNSKFYNKNAGGMIGYQGAWGHSYLILSNFDQHLGIVEGDRDSATGEFIKALPGGMEGIATEGDFSETKPLIPYQHIRHFKVSSDNTFQIGKSRLDAIFGYQRNQRQEFGNPDSPDEPDAYFDLKTFNYSAKLNLPANGDFKPTIGISGMAQQNTNRAEEVIIPDYNLFDAGLYLFGQYHHGNLLLSGGVRADNRHVNSKALLEGTEPKFDAFERDFFNISGSVGASYQISSVLTAKLNIARGFRAPNLAELGSNGAHEGTVRYEVGNKDLASETSFQVDGGLEVGSPHVTLDVSAFYNRIHNFIFYEKMPNASGGDSILIDPSGQELSVFRFDQHSAYLYGVEASLDIHPHPLDWLHIENTFSFTRGRFTSAIDGSSNVPFIPTALLITQLRGVFLPHGHVLHNLYVGVQSEYAFKQDNAFTGYNTETATGDYFLVDASAGADFVRGDKALFSVHITGNNLGDVAYQNHLSRFKYLATNNVTWRNGVFNSGRNFGIKVDVPLSFALKPAGRSATY